MDKLTKADLKKYFSKAESMNYYWKIGNDILYKMCKKYPYHKDDVEVIAKIWLIGRSYAASIERGAKDENNNKPEELIYEETVPKIFSEYRNKIDEALSKISKSDLQQIFYTYDLVLKCLHKVSNKWNRSLTSKYLHFHQPDYFYLMDSRAKIGLHNVLEALSINNRIKKTEITMYSVSTESEEYVKFYLKCQLCHKELEKEFNCKLSTREIDNLMLVIADDRNREKIKINDKTLGENHE